MVEEVTSDLIGSIGYSVFGFIIILLISFIYFSKIKEYTTTSKLYAGLLISSLLLCLMEMLFCITAKNYALLPNFYKVFARLTYLMGMIASLFIFMYAYAFAYPDKVEKFSKKRKIFTVIGLFLLEIIVFIITLFFDMTYVSNNLYVISGMAFWIACSFNVMIVLPSYIMIVVRKGRHFIFNYSVIFIFLFLFIIQIIQRVTSYNFNNITFFAICAITIAIYFTAESQDGKLIEELTSRQEEALVASNDKTNFLSNMSHEIRTPMSEIIGYSEIYLNNKDISKEEKKAYFDNIYTSSLLLKELVENMVDMSNIEAEKINFENDIYMVNDMVKEVNDNTLTVCENKGLNFFINVDENVPETLYGDRKYIVKIIELIINNAIKHTDMGQIDVNIGGTKSGNFFNLNIVIHNSGHLMKQEEFERDYENYAKVLSEDIRKLDTVSLGVGIAKKIIDMLNGNITFINEEGSGTKYIINLTQSIERSGQ